MFNKKTNKTIKVIWGFLIVIIIISMIMLYTPVFFGSGHTAPAQQQDSMTDDHNGSDQIDPPSLELDSGPADESLE